MKEEENNKLLIEQGYAESNRKTKAFYATLGTIVFLFIGTHWWAESPAKVIEQVVSLAMVYIGGLAVNDSVRYYKFGSKTMGNPEKEDQRAKQKELAERYKDK